VKIQYLGHASFLLVTNSGTRIVTDPFDPAAYPDTMRYKRFEGCADIVTISHDHRDHSEADVVKGNPVIIKGVGKFKAEEVDFLGVGTFHDDEKGSKRGKNTVFVISADGLTVAHMGDLGHVLTADQAAEIGAVDVVLLPIGGYYTIDPEQAWKVADQLSAQIVIPMHYANEKCSFTIAGVEAFTAGRANVTRKGVSTLEVTRETVPAEQQVIVLEPSL
jgi:L-ascorbate metabolism protein UlaG (beta-lactamase superfamily)